VPKFIKKIASRNLIGSAATILESNLLGATCARVCPVQELCEGACVLGAEHKPIAIGRLQRFAMDSISYLQKLPVSADKSNGRKVAVVGSGPAGLSCAGELAKLGYKVTLFEKKVMSGGLSTYGIISLREPNEISTREAARMFIDFGITFNSGWEVQKLHVLQRDFEAVFLGIGLGGTPALGIAGEEMVLDGLNYIENSKHAREALPLARQVLVIGAGNTAIDCATIAKRMGAERVTMVYRRTEKEMTAYPHEYEFIKSEGVEFRFLTQPIRVTSAASTGSEPFGRQRVTGLECVRMQLGAPDVSGRAAPVPIPGSEFVIEADQIIKAIGQDKPPLAAAFGLETVNGFIKVNDDFQTNLPGVYAGGDCIRAKGAASTVMAVQDGKLAAAAIHKALLTKERAGAKT
jgi:glutamate synthase (NADPH/NADH) small chain